MAIDETTPNKMMKADDAKTTDVQALSQSEVFEQDYSFTEYGIVISASSLEEATKKLQVILDNQNKQ